MVLFAVAWKMKVVDFGCGSRSHLSLHMTSEVFGALVKYPWLVCCPAQGSSQIEVEDTFLLEDASMLALGNKLLDDIVA